MRIGTETIREGLVRGPASLETVIQDTRAASTAWSERSSVATTSKAGGPNFLVHLGTWHSRPLRPAADSSMLRPNNAALLDVAPKHHDSRAHAELLPFLREQTVTITQHRFGNHDPSFDRVLPRLSHPCSCSWHDPRCAGFAGG